MVSRQWCFVICQIVWNGFHGDFSVTGLAIVCIKDRRILPVQSPWKYSPFETVLWRNKSLLLRRSKCWKSWRHSFARVRSWHGYTGFAYKTYPLKASRTIWTLFGLPHWRAVVFSSVLLPAMVTPDTRMSGVFVRRSSAWSGGTARKKDSGILQNRIVVLAESHKPWSLPTAPVNHQSSGIISSAHFTLVGFFGLLNNTVQKIVPRRLFCKDALCYFWKTGNKSYLTHAFMGVLRKP